MQFTLPWSIIEANAVIFQRHAATRATLSSEFGRLLFHGRVGSIPFSSPMRRFRSSPVGTYLDSRRIQQ
jgi:hypothetical protein